MQGDKPVPTPLATGMLPVKHDQLHLVLFCSPQSLLLKVELSKTNAYPKESGGVQMPGFSRLNPIFTRSVSKASPHYDAAETNIAAASWQRRFIGQPGELDKNRQLEEVYFWGGEGMGGEWGRTVE
ncbi:MAG: hypothetical protein BJ554DRAFT_374 [Olpidium bornovanus]|uniref:Uncharacterized protein n=1 Tax=Olpidium bornovanus TaxID=278681 RepID=A0A8H7ZU24_9FUNG|nr:MAG: hypothetical protein BJ554DRAFT_374 [Olpidium bornovanus]